MFIIQYSCNKRNATQTQQSMYHNNTPHFHSPRTAQRQIQYIRIRQFKRGAVTIAPVEPIPAYDVG